MRSFWLYLLLFQISIPVFAARIVVFQEPGFPTVDSEPVSFATLQSALGGDIIGADSDALRKPETLAGTSLLVLPYGSGLPVSAWTGIQAYLDHGGNLLVIGGQPLHVPIDGEHGHFTREFPQDTYGRVLQFDHTYSVPVASDARFSWRDGYTFLPPVALHAKAYYAVAGHLDGLGYMVSPDGDKLAAPVIVSDHPGGGDANHMPEARIVALDFDPQPGFWDSEQGQALIGSAARYAQAGAIQFWIETRFSALRPSEIPDLTLHLRCPQAPGGSASPLSGEAKVELLAKGRVIQMATVPMPSSPSMDVRIPFDHALPVGFYTVRATYSAGGHPLEFYSNGFVVEDLSALNRGPVLTVDGNFLNLDGKPFFPVGTNYFTSEDNGWDFSGPRNALVWQQDFADMERHGVTFIRTGVWMSNTRFIEPSTGGVNQRFLRNLEAFLAAAQAHHIAVNFNFFFATPQSAVVSHKNVGNQPPPPNPYLDPASVRMEQSYVLSVVRHFMHVPWLCYDLINEPSFSNPLVVYRGNVPNRDPVERRDWDQWLQSVYGTLDALARAWYVPPSSLRSFDRVPLPSAEDLTWTRYGNPDEVRALDYNLFAQAMFSRWAHGMVGAIRSTGSRQLIDVGQDEGGVTDRVLNQFFAASGVSFTVNHTYWQDDALLWDSVAAKYPGMPNITGETGYQPVSGPSGAWRYDEFTGQGLEERKWALGFAAGSSGALQWDWARDLYFGIERSDGSAKVWQEMMRNLGSFAKQAESYATGLQLPQVAIVLPQSLQLSVYNQQALKAQQTAVRVLYNYDRAAAYAVGEYQINTLGDPKLIIVPSPYGLTGHAWEVLKAHVRQGATLLLSGPFAEDSHLHRTHRAEDTGLAYQLAPLTLRDQNFTWKGDAIPLIYGGDSTTILSRATLPEHKDWKEVSLGKGHILFSALPMELNERLSATAAVYAYALQFAGVRPEYTTSISDPGILICPTLLPHATLYVLTSESNQTGVSFRDTRSGAMFTGMLAPGRAAILLVGEDGRLLAGYNWHGNP